MIVKVFFRGFLICLAAVLTGCAVHEIPGDPTPPQGTAYEREKDSSGVSLAVKETHKNGCIFELTNGEDSSITLFNLDYYLERLEEGAWTDCELLRCPEGVNLWISEIPAGESGFFSWDWSFPYGILIPGRYRLTIHGALDQRNGWEAAAEFEVTGEEVPLLPAPGPAPAPDWIKAEFHRVSNHKGLLSLNADPGHKVRWEEDYALFRKEGTNYILVPAAYRLPWGRGVLQDGGEWKQHINLAAAYGELQPGEYFLRKRLVDLTAWPDEGKTDWDLISQEMITLLDVPFRLEETISDVSRETDQWDRLLYVPSEPVEDRVVLQYEDVSSFGICVSLRNKGENDLILGYHWFLYFREGEEWFPVPLKARYGWTLTGMILTPGEEKTQDIPFEQEYGALLPGDYRLVQELSSGKLIFCEFEILN